MQKLWVQGGSPAGSGADEPQPGSGAEPQPGAGQGPAQKNVLTRHNHHYFALGLKAAKD